MISDESSSDSETGRFKCRSKTQSDHTNSSKREDHPRSDARNRHFDDKHRRDIDRRRSDREQLGRRSRDRQRYSRYSPVRRRQSRDRSPARKPHEHERSRHGRDYGERSKPRDHRSTSHERRRHSRSRSHKSPDLRRQIKDEHRKPIKEDIQSKEISKEKVYDKFHRTSRHTSPNDRKEKSVEKIDKVLEKSSSPEYKGKKSIVHKPPAEIPKKKSESPPIIIEHSESENVIQPGSYYSLIPTVTKEKSEESSEIDSSDDEKLRAKLLNLEKELHKTRRKKSKKRHRKKGSKSKEDRESANVEVSSTTDIDKPLPDVPAENTEVSSTQKHSQKEISEEGEISSDDSQEPVDIDPTDLRHKLRNTKRDMCGPALPPHLENKFRRSSSKDIEGPALPPHLSRTKNIGPSIPEDMRKVLAETDHSAMKYESSDEDTGIGPLPAGSEQKWSEAHERLEERALDMKIKKLDGHTGQKIYIKSREQWMLELPEAKAKILGLEARSFRAREGPDMSDRSSWTDTPEEKARKAAGGRVEDPEAALQREARASHIASRDEDQEKAARKHKKKHKRDESLLDLHQKKLKKKKKKEDKDEEKKERRPFNRDTDLQVNRFDEAQKKSIIKKAQELNTRFSRGEAKYL